MGHRPWKARQQGRVPSSVSGRPQMGPWRPGDFEHTGPVGRIRARVEFGELTIDRDGFVFAIRDAGAVEELAAWLATALKDPDTAG